jgi:superfamily II DNA helicase RecQ
MDAVREVYEFCKKVSVCRRVQILRHFDEDFDKEKCNKGCDNCQDGRQTVSRDVTTFVRNSIQLARRLRNERATFNQFGCILRGSKVADIVRKGFDQFEEYGSCQDLPKELFDLMLDEMMYLGLLTKLLIRGNMNYFNEYLSVSRRFQ